MPAANAGGNAARPANSIASAAERCAARTADYLPITLESGNLSGTCPDCGTRMYRRVSLQKLAAVAGDLQVQMPLAEQRIEDTSSPSLNSDFSHELEAHANAQSGK
jgi:predicted  nucleic acid-binding Zn-ribbon protein